ncbi:MAG: hypothetical protein NXI24_03845 [bacterium]|nr:hypothetical protein [bacterium]
MIQLCMNPGLFGRISVACAALFLLTACVSRVSTRQQRVLYVDQQLSEVNRQLIGRLFRFYRGVTEADLAAIQSRADADCSIEGAQEADSLYDGRKILYTGDYREGIARGKVCVWSTDGELLKFGDYDQDGRVRGLAVESLKGRPYIIEKYLPEKQLRVRRSFFLLDSEKRFYRVLVRLELNYEAEERQVRYVFDHVSSALLRRLETRVSATSGSREKIGLQFILSTNQLQPLCILHTESGKRQNVASDRCVLPIEADLVTGGNRI